MNARMKELLLFEWKLRMCLITLTLGDNQWREKKISNIMLHDKECKEYLRTGECIFEFIVLVE